jgi:hypothetical protein
MTHPDPLAGINFPCCSGTQIRYENGYLVEVLDDVGNIVGFGRHKSDPVLAGQRASQIAMAFNALGREMGDPAFDPPPVQLTWLDSTALGIADSLRGDRS